MTDTNRTITRIIYLALNHTHTHTHQNVVNNNNFESTTTTPLEKKNHLAIHTTFDDRLKNLFIKTTKIDGCWWTQKQNSLQDLND